MLFFLSAVALQAVDLHAKVELRLRVAALEQRGSGHAVHLHLSHGVLVLGQDVLQLLLEDLSGRDAVELLLLPPQLLWSPQLSSSRTFSQPLAGFTPEQREERRCSR